MIGLGVVPSPVQGGGVLPDVTGHASLTGSGEVELSGL